MRNAFMFVLRLCDKLVKHSICLGIKLWQFPRVWREYRAPSLISDETCRPAEGSVFAIAVKYAPFGVSADFLNWLATLNRTGFNTIVVCNGVLPEKEYDILRTHAHRILVRRNVGRDMGAYRAATLHLAADGLAPTRILYCNDSVFYLPGEELERLAHDLARNEADVLGTFENHEIIHHVGSYCLSLSGEAFADPAVQGFWRSYMPYSLRPHAISRGELALSRCLKRRGYSFAVRYSAERLAERLHQMDFGQLAELVSFMPTKFQRRPLLRTLDQPLAALSLSRPAGDGPPRAENAVPGLSQYRSRHPRQQDPAGAVPENVAAALARHALIDVLMLACTRGSQIHHGFGLFHRLLDAPLVKKDLLFRGIYYEHNCVLILDRLPADLRAAVLRDLTRLGYLVYLAPMRKLLAHYGIL